jgi:hypothetical protein
MLPHCPPTAEFQSAGALNAESSPVRDSRGLTVDSGTGQNSEPSTLLYSQESETPKRRSDKNDGRVCAMVCEIVLMF